jgi:hypothetical protein
MSKFQIFLLLGLFFMPYRLAVAESCNRGDQLWVNQGKLYFGKAKLSDEKHAKVLKASKECKKLFPFCNPSPLFAVTEKHVYFHDQPIKGADPKTFKYVCDDFGKDKKHVFNRTKKLLSQGAKEFEMDAKLGIYKTKTHVYNREGREIPGADPATIQSIEFNKKQLADYIQDKKGVYHLWGVHLNLRLKELKIFGMEYLGDNSKVYFRTKVIEGADPLTFKVLDPIGHLAEDKSNVFEEDHVRKKK